MRSLHGNSNPTKLRIFINEIIKPLSEQRQVQYLKTSIYCVHYFLAKDLQKFQLIFADGIFVTPQCTHLHQLFQTECRAITLELDVIEAIANKKIATQGDKKDPHYWGEITTRCNMLKKNGKTTLVLTNEKMASMAGDKVVVLAIKGEVR